jgi:cytidylate kinase
MSFTENRLLQIIREEVLHHQKRKINEALFGLIVEGVYDPGILKAVFMAGGPGSGKSYTAKDIFGGINKVEDKEAMQALIDNDIEVTETILKDATNSMSTEYGLRLVNSDPAFEKFLRDMGIEPSELAGMSDEEFEALTEPDDSPRGRAKTMKGHQQSQYMKGRIGLIVDGTGDDYPKMAAKKAQVEAIGYDTAMIFVNTSLEVALDRNRKRDRVLKDELVEEIWTKVQANLDQFQNLFGSDFIVVNNTSYSTDEAKVAAMDAARAFVESPIENPIGRKWVESELAWKEFERGPEDEQRKAPFQRERTLGDPDDPDREEKSGTGSRRRNA